MVSTNSNGKPGRECFRQKKVAVKFQRAKGMKFAELRRVHFGRTVWPVHQDDFNLFVNRLSAQTCEGVPQSLEGIRHHQDGAERRRPMRHVENCNDETG